MSGVVVTLRRDIQSPLGFDQMDENLAALRDAANANTQAIANTADSLAALRDVTTVWPRNNKIALLGHSMVVQGLDNTTDEARNSTRGLTHWLPMLTSRRFVSPQSLAFGVSGQTTEEIADRVGDVEASGSGLCAVLACTNDPDHGLTPERTIAALERIFDGLAESRTMILAAPFLPRTLSGEALYSYPQKVNDWLSRQGANYPGYKYIFPYVFGDQYSATYSPRSGYTYDGTHPMGHGMFSIAWPWAEFLNTLMPYPGPAVNSICDYFNSTNPGGVLNSNPLFGGTGGTLGSGVTGVVADGWRVQKFANGGDVSGLTVTCSKGTNSRTGGENQRIVIGGTATGGFDTCVILDNPAGIPNLAVGDVIQALSDIECPGGADDNGITSVEAYIAVEQSGTYKWARDGYGVVSDSYAYRSIPEGRLGATLAPLTGTLGVRLCGIKISLKNVGSARTFDLRVNNFGVRKVV